MAAAPFFAKKQHVQADSNDGSQLELLPPPGLNPVTEPATPEMVARVRRQPTLLDAWNYAQTCSGVADKAISSHLGIDPSHWTKIKQGNASPPADERFTKFMDALKSDIPLIWLCEARGYNFLTMERHQSDLEARLVAAERERDDYKRALELVVGRR
jgi:hypothetical protein